MSDAPTPGSPLDVSQAANDAPPPSDGGGSPGGGRGSEAGGDGGRAGAPLRTHIFTIPDAELADGVEFLGQSE